MTGIDAGFWRLPETGLLPLPRHVNSIRLLLINLPEKVFLPLIESLSHLLLLPLLVLVHRAVLDRPPTFVDLARIMARAGGHRPHGFASLAVLDHEGGRLWLGVDE